MNVEDSRIQDLTPHTLEWAYRAYTVPWKSQKDTNQETSARPLAKATQNGL